jgi:hypothetical protein
MRKAVVGGVLAAAIVGLSVSAAPPLDVYDDGSPKVPKGFGSATVFQHWFGPSNHSPAAPDKGGKKESPSGKAPAPKPSDPRAERRREEEVLQRRLAVVLRLQEIALETNDAELQRLAEQLDERVWAAYQQRVARLPAGKATFGGDEKVLADRLKPDAENVRQVPSPPQAAAGKDRGSRAAAGEGKQ